MLKGLFYIFIWWFVYHFLHGSALHGTKYGWCGKGGQEMHVESDKVSGVIGVE